MVFARIDEQGRKRRVLCWNGSGDDHVGGGQQRELSSAKVMSTKTCGRLLDMLWDQRDTLSV